MLVIRCRPLVTPCQHSPPQHATPRPNAPADKHTSARLQLWVLCVCPCSSARLCDVTLLLMGLPTQAHPHSTHMQAAGREKQRTSLHPPSVAP
jgi:hypothetical protein